MIAGKYIKSYFHQIIAGIGFAVLGKFRFSSGHKIDFPRTKHHRHIGILVLDAFQHIVYPTDMIHIKLSLLIFSVWRVDVGYGAVAVPFKICHIGIFGQPILWLIEIEHCRCVLRQRDRLFLPVRNLCPCLYDILLRVCHIVECDIDRILVVFEIDAGMGAAVDRLLREVDIIELSGHVAVGMG